MKNTHTQNLHNDGQPCKICNTWLKPINFMSRLSNLEWLVFVDKAEIWSSLPYEAHPRINFFSSFQPPLAILLFYSIKHTLNDTNKNKAVKWKCKWVLPCLSLTNYICIQDDMNACKKALSRSHHHHSLHGRWHT